jgi:hypothetical protein
MIHGDMQLGVTGVLVPLWSLRGPSRDQEISGCCSRDGKGGLGLALGLLEETSIHRGRVVGHPLRGGSGGGGHVVRDDVTWSGLQGSGGGRHLGKEGNKRR